MGPVFHEKPCLCQLSTQVKPLRRQPMVKVNVNKPKKSLLQRMNASVFWQNPCTPKSCSEWGCERLSVLSYASHAPELTYVDVNIGCVPSFAWLSGPPGDDDSEAPTSDTSSSHWVNDCPEFKIVFDPCTTCCRVIRTRRSTLEYLRQCMRASLVGLHMPPPPPHPL